MNEIIEALIDPVAGKDTRPTGEDSAADSELRKAEAAQLRSTTELREKFSDKVYKFNIAWSSCVFVILLLSGFGLWSFQLSDNVLIAVIGTALVNVIGLIAIILKGLFQS